MYVAKPVKTSQECYAAISLVTGIPKYMQFECSICKLGRDQASGDLDPVEVSSMSVHVFHSFCISGGKADFHGSLILVVSWKMSLP